MTVRLGHGQQIKVGVFRQSACEAGSEERGPNGRGAHLGLEVVGSVGRCSAGLIGEVVQLAVLCPSFEVAHQVLARRVIALDNKTLCRELGTKGLSHRGSVSLSGTEELSGQTLVIGIDGGRVRERRAKRGRRKAAQKCQGYHADWKEPKRFTPYVLDAQGQVVKDVAPWHDGTMEDHEGLFAVLDHYLEALDLRALDKVVFCGDGASWIWSGVEALCERYALPRERVYQVLDYTHAKQNLQVLVELLPARLKQAGRVAKRWKDLLCKGDLQGLYASLRQVLSGRKITPGAQEMAGLLPTPCPAHGV